MPDYSKYSDLSLTAICEWKESRGEIAEFGDVAGLAQAFVVVNRAQDWRWSIQHVILGPNQFTSMSVESDPEFDLLPDSDDLVFQKCLSHARTALDHSIPDPSRGAHWYANLKTMDQDGWFARHIVADKKLHPITLAIGHHTFFE
jgi:hypothetical protein